jgi:hypothetical protein
MTDIFREVDEDLRREQARRLWDRLGPYVLGVAVLIVLATAGYKGWTYWQEKQAAATGDRFLAALQLAKDGKHSEAAKAFGEIATNGSGGYPTLARFREAAEKALANDRTGAIADYDAIAKDSGVDTDVRDMAKLRAALLLVDDTPFTDMKSRIGDLASVGSPWRHTAREILGLSAWRTGDYVAARTYFDQIDNDVDSSKELRSRAQLMLALIAAKIGPEPAAAPEATPAKPAPATPTP